MGEGVKAEGEGQVVQWASGPSERRHKNKLYIER